MYGALRFSSVVQLQLLLNASALAFVVIWIFALHIPVGVRIDWELAKKMVRYGVQVQSGDLSSAANLRLDQVLMSAWMPPAVLGLYVVAVSASQLSDVVALAWRIVATPRIARKESVPERRQLLQISFRQYLLVSVPFICLLALAFPVVIPILFGKAFRPSITAAEILLVGAVFLSAKNVLGGGLQALGSPWLVSRADLVALVVTAVTLPPLLWRLGIVGAAIASTLAYGTQLLVVLYGLYRTHSISPGSLVWEPPHPALS
jgi:O-antigen/teichoic acid export membrane protein